MEYAMMGSPARASSGDGGDGADGGESHEG